MLSSSKTLFTALFAIALVSCGSDSTSSSQPQAEKGGKPTVALIMKSLANEFFVTMADGARSHQSARAADYDLIVNGIKNEIDLAQQVALIDQMIASGVDAIVIAPADSKAVVPALSRADQAGIVVVNIDNRLESEVLAEYGLQIPFVGPDNYAGAYEVGAYLAAQLSAGDQVAVLEGVTTTFNSQQRTQGFVDAMGAADINVVSQQSAQWDQTQAVTVASGMLVQHPELKALLCANDNMALGAIAAITQAGKAGQIAVVGFDNISAVRQLIREGQILATADQHADLLAVYGIEYALSALANDSSLEDKNTPVDLITADNIDP